MQLKLFNVAYYDKGRKLYIIETSSATYKIWENDDGTIKKTKGLGHGAIARNSFETNMAKNLAQQLAARLEQDYVEPTNRLPVLYKKGCVPIAYTYIIKKQNIANYDYFVKNTYKQGCTIKESSDQETIFVSFKNY